MHWFLLLHFSFFRWSFFASLPFFTASFVTVCCVNKLSKILDLWFRVSAHVDGFSALGFQLLQTSSCGAFVYGFFCLERVDLKFQI